MRYTWEELMDTITTDDPENYELTHHGIEGMRWGVQNGPPYPLDRAVSARVKASKALRTVKGEASKIKKRVVSKKDEILQKRAKKKEEEEETNKNKAVRSGDPKLVKETMTKLSKDQLEEAVRRVDIKEKLDSKEEPVKSRKEERRAKEIERIVRSGDSKTVQKNQSKLTKDQLEEAARRVELNKKLVDNEIHSKTTKDKIKDVGDGLKVSADSWNNLARWINTFSDEQVPFVNGESVKSQKEERQKKDEKRAADFAKAKAEKAEYEAKEAKARAKEAEYRNKAAEKEYKEAAKAASKSSFNNAMAATAATLAVPLIAETISPGGGGFDVQQWINEHPEDFYKPLMLEMKHAMDLYHHGILGMKWGVQNGPPYPLNRETSARIKARKNPGSNKKESVDRSKEAKTEKPKLTQDSFTSTKEYEGFYLSPILNLNDSSGKEQKVYASYWDDGPEENSIHLENINKAINDFKTIDREAKNSIKDYPTLHEDWEIEVKNLINPRIKSEHPIKDSIVVSYYEKGTGHTVEFEYDLERKKVTGYDFF